MKKLPSTLGILLRVLVTLGAAMLAFSQVKVSTVLPLLSSIPVDLLVLALVLLHFTQLAAALRTRFYLTYHKIELTPKQALKLQYVGELFSAFLPGGAGGDVYKAWWLKHHHQGKLFSMVKLMIANRLNGLWALGVSVCVLLLFSPEVKQYIYGTQIIFGALVSGTLFYVLVARFLLREPIRHQCRAAIYSVLLQSALVGMMWSLCLGLGLREHASEYISLFMLSCIVVLLPISIGGIGVRELTLLHGSRLLLLSEDKGVAMALAFTALNLSIPLVGACAHLLDHQKK